MKQYLLMCLWLTLSLCGAYAKVSIVVADIAADNVFLDKQDEKFYTDMLFGELYSQLNDRNYTYLLARTIGGSSLADWKIKNESEAYAVINDIDLDYLLYGTISSVDGYFETVFNLYSRQDEKVIKEIA